MSACSIIHMASAFVLLKDADHKVVFQGTSEHVQYVRRAQPGMTLDRETGRYSPPTAESTPAQTIHYTAYTPLPGAAGGAGAQTFTVNLSSGAGTIPA